MMEYYAAKKNNELPIQATTWLNLRNIKLSKGHQIHECYCRVPSPGRSRRGRANPQ